LTNIFTRSKGENDLSATEVIGVSNRGGGRSETPPPPCSPAFRATRGTPAWVSPHAGWAPASTRPLPALRGRTGPAGASQRVPRARPRATPQPLAQGSSAEGLEGRHVAPRLGAPKPGTPADVAPGLTGGRGRAGPRPPVSPRAGRPPLTALERPPGPPGRCPTPGPPTQRYALGAVQAHRGGPSAWANPRNGAARSRRGGKRSWSSPPPRLCRGRGRTRPRMPRRRAAGRLGWGALPPARPWRTPRERLWRPGRRDVTQGERFAKLKALVAAAQDVVTRYTRCPTRLLSIMEALPKNVSGCT
jgi:hypothetical protein